MKEGRVFPTRRKPQVAENAELVEVKPAKSDRSSLVAAWEVLHRQTNAISKWKHYSCTKRESRKSSQRRAGNILRRFQNGTEKEIKGFLDSDIEEDSLKQLGEIQVSNDNGNTQPALLQTQSSTTHTAANRALLIYFAKLVRADPSSPATVVDFDFVDSLLQSGADVNVCDRYGQTIFHEAARAWHCDVALFLLENGADLNKADRFGRTPMHVAAAVDYPEMITFLFEHGADVKACTLGELQTPVHYAAKNDADTALEMLIKIGADVNCRDYKQRTPLHVAAELDRSETAKCLLKHGVSAGVCDENGVTVLSLMVSKMPPVAKDALDQFHSLDRANRKQYYYLNYLAPRKPGEKEHVLAKTPLEEVVRYKQMDLIMHPVFKRLIQVKWDYFGKTGSVVQVCIQLLYCLIWTAIGISLPRATKASWSYYDPPSESWWRIVLESLAVSITALFIWQEIAEMRQSRRQHERWKNWRTEEMNRDLKYCHPRWPEESKYIQMEISNISTQGLSYFESYWNYFDWVTYFGILTVIVTRILSVAINNKTANNIHPKVMAIALIFIWLRLMKVFRAFEALGPFIVMIGHIVKDTLVFGFLYIEFFIPYVCAFWIVFGGDENAQKMKDAGQDSEGWRTFNNLMYSVWEITVVGNYSWDSLLVVDRLMAQILCGSYLAVSSIICINLFIALMSDTFQRVYDNANANAVMQKASTILALEADMSARKKDQFMTHIHTNCAPEEMYYDDDSVGPDSGELERLTQQIKDKVDEVEEMVKTTLEERQRDEVQCKHQVSRLREDLLQVIDRQNREMNGMKQDLADIKRLLAQSVISRNLQASPASPHLPSTSPHLPSTSTHLPPTSTHLQADPVTPPPRASPKAHSSKSRKHRDKTPTNQPPLDGIAQEAVSSSLPGVDIRREQPARDVALVKPGQGLGTHSSSC